MTNNEQNFRKFAEWVADEVFNELWEINYDSFAEIACRKLAKLGIVKATKNKWILAKLPEWKQVQEPCEDAISRQAVIDAIFSEPLYKPGLKKRGAEEAVPAIYEKIKALPSVSTEKKNVEIVKFDTPYTDAISRQAAIDAMREETCLSCWDAKYILEHLPPVSTEKTESEDKG